MKFEYLIKIAPSLEILNELGSEGLELIVINEDKFYFKRTIFDSYIVNQNEIVTRLL